MCHDELAESFAGNLHQRSNPEGSCESCHGAGSAHVDEADPDLIRRFGSAAAAVDINSTCNTCHDRDLGHRNW